MEEEKELRIFMWKAKIEVTLKKSVLDPQGATVAKSLEALGYNNLKDIRIGKYLELTLQNVSKEQGEEQVKEMCRRLLVNPVIEDYVFELVETDLKVRSGR